MIGIITDQARNLESDTFVPEHMITTMMTMRAVNKFKGLVAAKNLRQREEKRAQVEQEALVAKMEARGFDAQLVAIVSATQDTRDYVKAEIAQIREDLQNNLRTDLRTEIAAELQQHLDCHLDKISELLLQKQQG